jgi:hypothetical protein
MALLWAMSLPGLVVLLVALAALERMGLWATRVDLDSGMVRLTPLAHGKLRRAGSGGLGRRVDEQA